jgi:putative nucleotidyltransferase with HDIG domain
MKKKIKVEQLRPGMYIDDFNCSWLDHPFFSNSIKVKNDNIIEKTVDNGIREVYIDTDKGLDVDDAPTEEEVKQEIETEFSKVLKSEREVTNPVSLKEEIIKAKVIKKEAKQTLQKVMEDIRLGKQIKLEKVESTVEKMVDSIFRNQDALANLCRIKETDEYTFSHSVSVCVLMISFAKHLGLDSQTIKEVGMGGLLHDIGKTNTPVEILNKKDRLTEDEFITMKEHAVQGIVLLYDYSDIYEKSVCVAAHHHERFDGTGYPNGLKGEEISKFGQMAGIVDVYDAITSDRCYCKGMQPTEALKKLFEWSKFHFNSDLVQQFIQCVGIYPVGTLVLLESGMLSIVLNHGEKSLLQPAVRIVFDTNKMKYVTPYDIDLSHGGNKDKIKSYESPNKWHIRPEMYL